MRVTASPPSLTASDVFGERLQPHLKVLVRTLQPHIPGLERRFLGRLQRLGYDPRQRKALAAIVPGAATRGSPPAFIEQVQYNGRRLAKLNLPPARILQALEEYDRLLAPVVIQLEARQQKNFNRALEQWYFCAVLTLNNAFREVAEAETLTYQELFRWELESGSLDELLLRMLESLCRYCRAQGGALYLLVRRDPECFLRVAASCGELEPVVEPGVACSAAAWRRLAKARCVVAGSRRIDFVLQPSWRSGFPTCWSVPLTLEGRRLGVLQFGFSKPYEWLPREVELLSAAAERCVLAAEKARLVLDLAARESQIRELAGRMLEVEERERRRISSELHDEAGQSLLCIRLQLEMLEAVAPENRPDLKSGLSEARALTERTIVEIRRLIADLCPAVLQQLGLAAALRQLATRLRQSHNIKLKLHLAPPRELGEQAKTAIYRLVQECLSNVARHSSALNVNISVVSADGSIRLRVEDDGVGFQVEEVAAKRGSYGLAGMRERVALLGGKFHVDSQPGQGTRVSIELPPSGKRGRSDQEVE